MRTFSWPTATELSSLWTVQGKAFGAPARLHSPQKTWQSTCAVRHSGLPCVFEASPLFMPALLSFGVWPFSFVVQASPENQPQQPLSRYREELFFATILRP